MVDAPRKETISSRISGMLREQILKGELAPGSKVNLDRLREQHDVSISPLREAVSRLVADGLVEFEDQRGYRVVPVSRENLAEVIMLRSELEVMALRQSIAHGDLEWESNVIRALHRLTHTSRDNDGLDAWEAAHTGFHTALVSGCAMPLLITFCTMLNNMSDRYRRLLPRSDAEDRNVAAEHEAIAMAATARDADEACDALKRHILKTGEGLAERFGAGR